MSGYQKHCVKHCIKIVRFRSFSGPYSVQMWENLDQENYECEIFLRSEKGSLS